MKESFAELHARYPYDRDERAWLAYGTFEDAIANAGDLHLQTDPMAYLENIRSSDYKRAADINRALLFLPPQVVIDSLGEEVALWASIASDISGYSDDMDATLEEKLGYSMKDIEIARGFNYRKQLMRESVPGVLAQYSLMQAVRSDAVANIDLPAILQDSAKEGIELSSSRVDDYALIPIEAENYNTYYDGGHIKGWDDDEEKGIGYSSWIDTPTGFALTYKGIPNAIAGLAMHSTDTVMIHQLQGVKANRIDPSKSVYSKERVLGKISSRGLMPLDWQKVMVQTAEQVTRTLDIPKAGILASENNVWTKKRFRTDTVPHITLEQAANAYDKPAERLGYVRDKTKQNNWKKQL